LIIFHQRLLETFLEKLTIVITFWGISFYLLKYIILKYIIRLNEKIDEYRYKALTLSTFPALNYFLQDDKSRFGLIKTIVLENQKLQTLDSKEDKLSIDEILKILSVFKSDK